MSFPSSAVGKPKRMSNPPHNGNAPEKGSFEGGGEEERRAAVSEASRHSPTDTVTDTHEAAEVVVDWDGPDDPQNPKK